jgi:hypothetical protein
MDLDHEALSRCVGIARIIQPLPRDEPNLGSSAESADTGFAKAEFRWVLAEPAWAPFVARVGAITHGIHARAAHASIAVIEANPINAFGTGGPILDAAAIAHEANLVEAMARGFSEYALRVAFLAGAIGYDATTDTAVTTDTADTTITSRATRARCLAAAHRGQRQHANESK